MSKRTRTSGIGALIGCMASVTILSLFSGSSAAAAGRGDFDRQMNVIAKEYLKVTKALAADSIKGVAKVAKKIYRLSKKLKLSLAEAKKNKHYIKIPKKLIASSRKFLAAKTISGYREALKDLSKPMALWATLADPPEIDVVYCSMAPGSWLQRKGPIANPYYGSKMLRCGKVLAKNKVK